VLAQLTVREAPVAVGIGVLRVEADGFGKLLNRHLVKAVVEVVDP